jgi:hypothetical protein
VGADNMPRQGPTIICPNSYRECTKSPSNIISKSCQWALGLRVRGKTHTIGIERVGYARFSV